MSRELQARYDVLLQKLSDGYEMIYNRFRYIVAKATKGIRLSDKGFNAYVQECVKKLRDQPMHQREFVNVMKSKDQRTPKLCAKAVDMTNHMCHFSRLQRGTGRLGRYQEIPDFWEGLYHMLIRLILQYPDTYLDEKRLDIAMYSHFDSVFRTFISKFVSIEMPPQSDVFPATQDIVQHSHREVEYESKPLDRPHSRLEVPMSELSTASSYRNMPSYNSQMLRRAPSQVSRRSNATGGVRSQISRRPPIHIQVPTHTIK
jgi:hypothetical protein